MLAGLEAQGWVAIHHVSLGRGNVDHVLVGPGGIFAIETKSHRGKIAVAAIEDWMLRQAYAERKLIERTTGMRVEALLVFWESCPAAMREQPASVARTPVGRQRGSWSLVKPEVRRGGHPG